MELNNEAVAKIAEIIGEEEANRLRFEEEALNPYRNGVATMQVMASDRWEAWTDGDRLIQMAPPASAPPRKYAVRPETRIGIPALRLKAREVMTKMRPGFDPIGMHPLEDNRNREVYFFRFDDASGTVSETELPPFIQVGLRADGELVSATNTLMGMGNAK